ncbi:hypothetical protein D3C75_1195080 [compost metagenome]
MVIALQAEALLAVGSYLALQHGTVDGGREILEFGPRQVRGLSEGLRMLVAGQQGEPVVVDLRQLRPPEQQHGHGRVNHDVHRGAQALRPMAGSP